MSSRRDILARIREIEALPAAVAQALGMLRNPESPFSKIAKIIEHDPGLASGVLKLANSAMFAGPRKIGSIQTALVRLGARQVTGLLLTRAVAPLIGRPLCGYDLPAGSLWEHSIGAAIATSKLAQVLGITPPPQVYTGALLHDIGKVVLGTALQIDSAIIKKLAFDQVISFEIAEQQVLGIDHAEAGALLLENWRLPRETTELVRWHHQPENYTGDQTQAMDLVHAAAQMVMLTGSGVGIDGTHYAINEETVSRLKLKTALIETVLCQVMEELDIARGLFAAAA